jgi:hypothetical protein
MLAHVKVRDMKQNLKKKQKLAAARAELFQTAVIDAFVSYTLRALQMPYMDHMFCISSVRRL